MDVFANLFYISAIDYCYMTYFVIPTFKTRFKREHLLSFFGSFGNEVFLVYRYK